MSALPTEPAKPTLSIIVVCKNPGPPLRESLASVWAQRSASLELIVVDGASTDGTPEWLAQERHRIDIVVSEPDAGIYDAMNKGVAAAHSEWVLFLGADDRLVGDETLGAMLRWAAKTAAGVVAGEAAYSDGRIYRLRSRVNPRARNFVHHQAALYRRSLFTENGAFDTTLSIMADYDFNVRLWKNRVGFEPSPLRISACGTHGASDNGAWRVYREEIKVRHRYFPAWRCWIWDLVSLVRYARKQLLVRARRHG